MSDFSKDDDDKDLDLQGDTTNYFEEDDSLDAFEDEYSDMPEDHEFEDMGQGIPPQNTAKAKFAKALLYTIIGVIVLGGAFVAYSALFSSPDTGNTMPPQQMEITEAEQTMQDNLAGMEDPLQDTNQSELPPVAEEGADPSGMALPGDMEQQDTMDMAAMEDPFQQQDQNMEPNESGFGFDEGLNDNQQTPSDDFGFENTADQESGFGADENNQANIMADETDMQGEAQQQADVQANMQADMEPDFALQENEGNVAPAPEVESEPMEMAQNAPAQQDGEPMEFRPMDDVTAQIQEDAATATQPQQDDAQNNAQREAFLRSMQQMTQQMNQLSATLQNMQSNMNSMEVRLNALESNSNEAAPVQAQAPTVGTSELEQQIDRLQSKVSSLESNVRERDAEATRAAAAAAAARRAATTAPAPAARPQAAPAPSRPAVQSESSVRWTLQSAQPGKAWLRANGSSDAVTVTTGSSLPGLGNITFIGQENGRWVVRGTQGQVTD